MTSMTTSQQTDRRGTDEIPGPRGGQGVRLLVLGADGDAQELRDQAKAAGYELAQRYSARVSHVAYGSGVDPEDARYVKIREAGLALLPLQKCAAELGLRADAAEAVETVEVESDAETETKVEVEELPEAEFSVETEPEAETGVETEIETDDEPLDFPPLHTDSDDESEELDEELNASEEVAPSEDLSTSEDFDASEFLYDHEALNAFVPGFTEEHAEPDVPLAAAVIGADPWEGELAAADTSETPDTPEIPEASATPETPAGLETPDAPATRTPDSGLGRILLSVLWALIPLATFGLLTPVTFGYAAYRLRSRGLALTAFAYTLAVVLAFVLSAIRPHASTPADTTGALLTVCLAGTWIGGTLHALSLRTRVFVRGRAA
jgi:hypothetical protein